MIKRKVFCKLVEHKGRKVWMTLPSQYDSVGNDIVEVTVALEQRQIDRENYRIGCIVAIDPDQMSLAKTKKHYTYAGDVLKIFETHNAASTNAEYAEYQKYKGMSYEELCELTEKLTKTMLYQLQHDDSIVPLTIEKDGFYITDADFQLIVRNIKRQVNTMMLGPTGSGKTEVIMKIADQLGIPCRPYDMGAMHDPISDLLGVHRLDAGKSVFDYARFVDDVQKPGIIVLDELSRCPMTALNILFPVLDSRRTLPIEIAGCKDTREVKVHPECVFIATANIGLEYTGTSTLDKALTNRFFPIEFSYLPKDIETKVLQRRCGITSTEAKMIADIATDIRQLYSNQDLTTAVSTRETLMIASLVADGWELVNSLKTVLLPLYEKEEREKVTKLLMGK